MKHFCTVFGLVSLVIAETKNTGQWSSRQVRAITEPAWVTELLGPTEFPPSTTYPPSLPVRIHNAVNTGIKHVQNTIYQFPNTITQLIKEIHTGAHNILQGNRFTTRRPIDIPINFQTRTPQAATTPFRRFFYYKNL